MRAKHYAGAVDGGSNDGGVEDGCMEFSIVMLARSHAVRAAFARNRLTFCTVCIYSAL